MSPGLCLSLIHIFSYDEDRETWVKRQTIPSPLGSGEKMTSVNWLFGDMSLVCLLYTSRCV